jgi:hypothetical protein
LHVDERVSGVESNFGAGHRCHHLLRLRLEGEAAVGIRAASVAGHAEAEPRRRLACLARGENSHLVTATVEQRRR